MSEFAGFEGIAASPIARELTLRLTFALLHFVWQGTLIGLIAAGAAWCLRNRPARRRYGVHVAALVALSLCVPVTFAVVRIPELPVTRSSDLVPRVASNNGSAEVSSARSPVPAFEASTAPDPEPLVNNAEPVIASIPAVAFDTATAERPSNFPMAAAWCITAVYVMGVCLMLLRLTAALWGGQRLRAGCTAVTDIKLLELISHQARSVGLKSVPAVAWCERIAVPMVVGIVRPLVLLPASLATGLDSSQLAAIISHELAHIRRFDLVVNLFQRIVESLLFFHPAVWWISRRMSSERELSCDDLVIQAGCEQLRYADALIRMAEICTARRPSLLPQLAALRATGGGRSDLTRRVYRLLGATDTPKFCGRWPLLLTVTVLGIAAAAYAIIPVHQDLQADQASIADKAPTSSQAEETKSGNGLSNRNERDGRATISGRIVMKDGSPATVKGWMYYHSRIENHTSHGTDGQYTDRFSCTAPAGTTWLSYFPDDHAPTWAGPFDMKPGEHRKDVTLVLKSGFSKLIKVTDEQGQPVANATLVAHPEIFENVSGPVREHTTGGDGECLLEHLADTRYALRIRAPGYQPLRTSPLAIEAGGVLQLMMHQSEPCRGVVRHADGTPAAGAKLHMKCEIIADEGIVESKESDDGFWGQRMTTTDERGRFALDQLSSDAKYLFIVEADDGSRAITDALQAGEQDVQIVLPKRHDLSVTITGNTETLPRREGKPFVSMRQRVAFRTAEGTNASELIGSDVPVEVTEEGGTAILRGLAVDLRPEADRQEIEVSLGYDRLTTKTIELNPNGATHVEFVLAERTEDPNTTTQEQSTRTSESSVSDQSTGSAPPAEEQVDTATITGTVVDTDDAPVAGVRVSTQWYQGQGEALTDVAGRFQLEVPRERIIGRTVRASAESGRLQAQHQLPWDIDKTENPSGIRLQLHPAQRVELHVVDAEGEPVAGAKAGLLANFVNFEHGVTDESGQIAFLLPHDLTVTNVYAFADHKGMDYRAYVLPRGRDRDQNAKPPQLPQEPIRLTLDGVKPLTVRVQEPDGSPIVGISLYPWLMKKPDQPQDLNLSSFIDLVEEQTDSTGTAVFNWFPQWHEQLIQVWPRDKEHVHQRGSYDPKAGDGTLVMTLDRLVPIGGRVTMPDGSPAAGITITAKGEGHQIDGFQGSATTDADGRYEIMAAPNMVYLLIASGNGLAAAPQTDFAVWPDQPRDDLDFLLRPATRLFGRVTMGDERKPVEGQRIDVYQYGGDAHNNKDVNLPNPEGSNNWVQPLLVKYAVTDAEGRFEVSVGPGKFDIRGPSQNEVEKFEISDETSREFNFHAARPERGLLAGEVVIADSGAPVPEAEVYGIYRHALAGLDMKATTDQSGQFNVDRELHRTVIHARSKDGKLAAVVEIGPDDETVTIPIRPVAKAHGRLIDQATGEPMPGEEIRYGVNVHIGDDDAPFRTSFGGTATTDDEGRFRLKDLILGQEYSVTVTVRGSDNPNDVSWHRIGNVVPEEARDIDLGDMQLKPAYRTPTIAERVVSAFSSEKTPVERFEAARSDAGLSHQHVLILFGDPDGNAVKQFMELRYGESDVRRTFDPFRFLAIDSSGGKLSAARELGNQLDLWLGDGREVFSVIITDAQGQPLANADAGRLMHGGTISQEKVTAFLAKHAPAPLDAKTLLDEALARAKAENKRVIVQETATWCGPCWRLSRFLNDHRDKWEGDYILVKMDHRWTGSREVMEKLRDGAEGGIPWWAILDADGDTLVTSNDSDGDNIGFPSNADGRAHFRTMLQTTAIRMTDAQIGELVDALVSDE